MIFANVNRFLLTVTFLSLVGVSCNLLSRVTPAAVTPTSHVLPQVVVTLDPSPLPTTARPAVTPTFAPTAVPSLTPSTPAARIPTDWLSYTNSVYGITLSYPPQGEMEDLPPDQARINLPLLEGTNLQEKYLEIDLMRGGEECASPIASGYDPASIQSEIVEINGTVFNRQNGGEGAAGNYYSWQAYTTQRGDVCASLTFVLHSTNAMFYDPPLAEYDEPAEAAVFQKILETFAWLP
jgi:hypothetical protein